MLRKPIATLCGCVLALSCQTAVGAEIEIIPISASGGHVITGNEIVLSGPGQRVVLELYISDWDPDLDGDPILRAWQIQVDSQDWSSGTLGEIKPASVPCSSQPDPDRFCRSVFGGACRLSGGPCVDSSDCTMGAADQCMGPACEFTSTSQQLCAPAFILAGRTDYVFRLDEISPVDISQPDFRYSSSTFSGPGVEDPGARRYAGTLILDVLLNVNGRFEVGMIEEGTALFKPPEDRLPRNLTSAFIVVPCTTGDQCDDDDLCTSNICQPNGLCRNRPNFDTFNECCDAADGLVCSEATGMPGDVDGSGTVDLADLSLMQQCLGLASIGPACAPLDLVCDCNVALDDYAEFVPLLGGPLAAP